MNGLLKIDFYEDTVFENLDIDYDVDEIYIDKSSVGKSKDEKLIHNFLAVGRQNNAAKKLIAELSSHAFYLVKHTNGVSVFKKFKDSNVFINSFEDKNIKCWNDTFYTLDEPVSKGGSKKRLLVVFSSIADLPFNASISRRVFFKNFSTIAKYIPKNTYVLRIADLGGVLGGFYLNSNADSNFENKVQNLIRKVQKDESIADAQVVFYGGSKGATGALYHGLKMGIKTLAVDPIVSDEFYIKKYNDLHFVEGAFPCYKQEKFNDLMLKNSNRKLDFIKIITSPNSEQYSYIQNIIFSSNTTINNYIFSNPYIKSHPDVGKQTLNFATAMINNLLYDVSMDTSFISEF